MEKKYVDIFNEGKKDGKTIEEINKLLKEAGANFHLNADGGTEGWTEAEMAEGFIQWIPGGKFEVEYDELGYAKSAVRVND